MKLRQLGKSGPAVSAIRVGMHGHVQSYGPGDDEESVRTLQRALDLGVTFFDTAAARARRETSGWLAARSAIAGTK